MCTSNSTNNGPSTDICGVLFIVFLVLKLCKLIDWSWWWVTAPLWGPIAFVLILAIIGVIVSEIFY